MELKGIVDEYLSVFPDEGPRLMQLRQLLNTGDPLRLYDHTYPEGHITASAFILSPCKEKVLLVHPLQLTMFIQPGGSIEPWDSSPLAEALRAVAAESGTTGLRQLLTNTHDLVPFDIDSHRNPASGSKYEPCHYHHEFRYLFVGGAAELNPMPEVAHRWVSIDLLPSVGPYEAVAGKIRCALSKDVRATMFYDRIIACLDVRPRVDTIVIAHFIPDVLPYLDALSQISNVRTIIPKPKSIVRAVERRIQRQFSVTAFTREEIAKGGVGSLISNSPRVALLDIGGYFAPVLSRLSSDTARQLLGVIEDTENGHQRYATVRTGTVPIFSVARSPLKSTEDFLVGQSVVFSADAVLRGLGQLLQYSRIGIFGFGKIGRSIFHHLMQRNIKPLVYDSNPLKRLDAYNLGAEIPNREMLTSEAEVIFSATGGRALSIGDFTKLKPGCFVFSVTSADDEMDLSHLDTHYEEHIINERVRKLYGRDNHFYLVNGGNAVNFLHNAVLGDFIHLVRAEMLFALEALSRGGVPHGIQEVSDVVRERIASIWLDTYVDDKHNP
jgi:adenosylhomocysteinase